MRGYWVAIGLAGAALLPTQAQAQTFAPSPQASSSAQLKSSDVSAQSRQRRPRVRIYREDDDRGVYPSYNPGPNAVRDCTATYVQEFRPSGTVIVSRMNCYWRRG